MPSSLVLREGDAEAGVQPYQFDDSLIQGVRETDRPRWNLYQPAMTMVVVGRNSRLEQEVDLERCTGLGLPIYRRYGGGCSVVLDPGNIVVSIVFPTAALVSSRLYFARATQWVIDGLQDIGVTQVRCDGISDLVVGDRKIGGSCIYQTKSFVYFSTTILVQPDFSIIAACLRHPPREPVYRNGRSHEAFLMGIGNNLVIAQALNLALKERFLQPDH